MIRIKEHLSEIRNPRASEKSNITRHISQCNGGHTSYFSAFQSEIRGGDLMNLLPRREVFWIFHLQTRLPLGLNYEFNVTCYT
ncbi:hypothetical protein XELAEV_18034003mg [Xenopus laevis]|uniref:Uncharacterized protein n=1 Tax=Xenopus laevis TaxID=8355 RepID=A0A974CKC1_XENLA|nr:hypothetical protein XELAEV_18034003mg [Xenopus laevis]